MTLFIRHANHKQKRVWKRSKVIRSSNRPLYVARKLTTFPTQSSARMKFEAFWRPKLALSAIGQAQSSTDEDYATNGSSVSVEFRKRSYAGSYSLITRPSGKEVSFKVPLVPEEEFGESSPSWRYSNSVVRPYVSAHIPLLTASKELGFFLITNP